MMNKKISSATPRRVKRIGSALGAERKKIKEPAPPKCADSKGLGPYSSVERLGRRLMLTSQRPKKMEPMLTIVVAMMA